MRARASVPCFVRALLAPYLHALLLVRFQPWKSAATRLSERALLLARKTRDGACANHVHGSGGGNRTEEKGSAQTCETARVFKSTPLGNVRSHRFSHSKCTCELLRYPFSGTPIIKAHPGNASTSAQKFDHVRPVQWACARARACSMCASCAQDKHQRPRRSSSIDVRVEV